MLEKNKTTEQTKQLYSLTQDPLKSVKLLSWALAQTLTMAADTFKQK